MVWYGQIKKEQHKCFILVTRHIQFTFVLVYLRIEKKKKKPRHKTKLSLYWCGIFVVQPSRCSVVHIIHSYNSTTAITENFMSSRNFFCNCHCWVFVCLFVCFLQLPFFSFRNCRNFFCKCHFCVLRMIDSHYYSSREISRRGVKTLVDYRMSYIKVLLFITKKWTDPVPCNKLWVSPTAPTGLTTPTGLAMVLSIVWSRIFLLCPFHILFTRNWLWEDVLVFCQTDTPRFSLIMYCYWTI